MSDRDLNISAVFSDCGRFRQILRARWDTSRPTLGWLCLNPSDAGRLDPALGYVKGDPSVRKMAGFSDRLGFGALVLGNLYDYIATYPKDLKSAGYPRSLDADQWLARLVQEAGGQVVCGWGRNAAKLSRPAEVLAQLRALGAKPKALLLLDDGTPGHPLMLPYSCQLQDLA